MVAVTGSLASTVGEKNPYRYRGYRYDAETGLYYLQSRYYSPEWGRFVNSDGLLGEPGELLSHNMFAYCLNNPVNMEDPNGESGVWQKAKREWTLFKMKASIATAGGILLTATIWHDTHGGLGISPSKGISKGMGNSARGLIGKDFENFLVKKLGGRGSFKAGGREFDGAIGNRWYEAKSGRYWEDVVSSSKGLEKFKSDMGSRLNIAKQNGASYELHSNTPIPSTVKEWLKKKGIKYTEWK